MSTRRFPKINSIGFGGQMIALAIIIGGLLPLVLWFVFDKVFWWLIAIGGIILLALLLILVIEGIQDNSKIPYYERDLRNKIPFDEQKQYAVIRSSICTGEKVAGFKNIDDGHFTDVMLIRNQYDEERFMKIYGLKSVKREY